MKLAFTATDVSSAPGGTSKVALRSRIAAQGRVGLMLNVRRADLSSVLGLLPALQRPTISALSDDDWVAVNTIIEERTVRDLIPRLKAAVTEALTTALTASGTPALVMCHISHVYPTGASLYFTIVAGQRGDVAEQWHKAKVAACDALMANGGTITHHHAVGADHRPWMTAEIGELGVQILRAVKQTLDPAGILNPGKLIP
mgnify:CR=1 FL=1